VPIAERLVFREPFQKLNIEIVNLDNSLEYSPGSNVTIQIKTTDQYGSPVSAIVGVTVIYKVLYRE
jgi:hypothetical protein